MIKVGSVQLISGSRRSYLQDEVNGQTIPHLDIYLVAQDPRGMRPHALQRLTPLSVRENKVSLEDGGGIRPNASINPD